MSRGSSSVRTVGRFSGGLIQTSAAGVSGLGTPRTNRFGWRAWAAASTEARASRAAVAWPVCTTAGVRSPIPQWQCSSLCQRKNPRQKSSPWSWLAKRSGKSGRYFSVLNWLSEKGLSSLTWGLLWD